MYLFLLFFSLRTSLRQCIGPNIVDDISRLGGFNSRLSRRKFPVRVATGIRWQSPDFDVQFSRTNDGRMGKSTKFPVRREKPGIVPVPAQPWRQALPTPLPITVAL
jgi:hypothetical protein